MINLHGEHANALLTLIEKACNPYKVTALLLASLDMLDLQDLLPGSAGISFEQ